MFAFLAFIAFLIAALVQFTILHQPYASAWFLLGMSLLALHWAFGVDLPAFSLARRPARQPAAPEQ